MKKIIAMVLCFVVAMSLAACASSNEGNGVADATNDQKNSFSAGYARIELPATAGLTLQGYDKTDERIATATMDPLYTTCVAMRDAEGNFALMISVDSLFVEEVVATLTRRKIENELGIPMDNILIVATHTHAAPGAAAMNVAEKTVEAAKLAVEDLKPAKVFIGTGTTKNLNFVRHYIMDDGSTVGANYGDPTGKQYVGHVTDADNELRLIQFTREGGKDIIMMNWQSHPLFTSGMTKTEISADFIGACRVAVEKKLDCEFAYYQGAAGNINPYSYITSENVVDGYYQHGNALADAVAKTIKKNMKEMEPGLIKSTAHNYEGKVRKDTGEMIAAGLRFKDVYDSGGSVYEAQKASGGLINSIYTVYGMQNRQSLGEYKGIGIYAVSLGDIAFIGAPYEMFDTNGMQIRERSPFEMTFVCGYCNGRNAYIPSAIGFEKGCYEMDNGYFVAGTGELLVDEYVKMLESIK